MTKKAFIALANTIQDYNDRERARHCDAVKAGAHNVPPPQAFTPDQLLALADFCKSQNPAFDRERWLDYIADRVAGRCGPNGGNRQ